MKWIIALLVALVLLSPIGLPVLHADVIPDFPRVPVRSSDAPAVNRQRSSDAPAVNRHRVVTYTIAGSVVAVTATGSLAALYFLRKRYDN
jgi:hypothetical protein